MYTERQSRVETAFRYIFCPNPELHTENKDCLPESQRAFSNYADSVLSYSMRPSIMVRSTFIAHHGNPFFAEKIHCR